VSDGVPFEPPIQQDEYAVKSTPLRFIIAQVQDDFYGNVGTYTTETRLTETRYVDNKNRVLSLRTTLGSLGSMMENRWFESTLGH